MTIPGRAERGHYFPDTSLAIPNAAAAASPPISTVRSALDTRGMPV